MEDTCIVRGNLFEEFETPVKASENPKKEKENTTNKEQTLKVFLRVRPQLEKEQGEEKLTCFQIDDKDQELTAKAPKDSFNFKSAFRGCSELQHKFTFTKIFGPHTGQKDIFNETVLQSVKESANGKNALIFTYGVTNSGKSYTINGSSKDTGILPRAVDVLFNSIGDQLYSKHLVKTLNHSDFILLDDKEQAEEAATKSKLLDLLGLHDHKQSLLTNNSSGSSCENSLADTSKLSNQTTTSAASSLQHEDSCLICSLGREIDQRIIEDTVIEIENLYDYKYAVWVSYAEVYNEQIFDLLAAPSKKKKERRPVLRQKQDHRGNVYVKDLKEVLVTDRQEAYKLFKIGQRNQQIAATKLNQQSSRSHCIFNIKIVQIIDGIKPEVINTSQLCFVDLAGSERQAKTQALGMHIGEAGKINNSLMTLGKCIEAMRYNQYHRNHPRIVPFRESQLTRWLQNHFAGRGLISMIVNISPCTQVYDETLHVLKFSAIAKQVTTVPKPEIPSLPLMPRISIAWENDTNISIEKEESDSTDTRITGLLELIELLKDALVEKEREIILAEEKARKEVADEFQQQFEKRQAEWEEHTQQLVSLREEKYEKKIEILQKTIKKRKRNASESDVEDEQYSYDSLDTTPTKNGKDSNKIINDLKVQVNNLREVNNKLEEDAAKASVDNDKIYELQIRNEELQKMVTERELKLRAIQWPKTDVIIQASSAEPCKEYPEKDAKILDLEYALREKCELVQFLELELDSFKKTTEEAEATAATARENLERLNEQHQQNILSTDPQQQIQELVAYKDENQELMQSVAKLTRNCEMHKMEVQNSQKNEKELEVALSGKNNLIDNLKEQLKHSCQESGKLQQQLLDSEGIVDSLTERSNVLSSKLESTEKKIQFYEEEFVHYRNLLNKNENNTNGVDVVDNTNHIITEVAVTSATSDQPVQCNFFDEIDQRVQSLEEDNALLQETVSKKCGEVVFLEDALKELRRVHEDFIGNEKSLKDKLNGCSDLQVQIDALQNQLSQLEESEQRKSTKLISMEDELKEARQALNQYKEQLEKTLQATDEERLTVSNEIDSLKAANELLREESDSNQQELQSVIDSKSQKIAELNDQVHNVTKEKRELSDENSSLLQQLSDLKIQISDLNTKNEAKSEMLGNLQKDLTNKVDELNRVKDQFGSCSEQLCDTKKDLTNKVDELNRVKDQFGSCSEQLCDTEKNLNEAKVNFEELTADNSDKARCISDLKEQLAETKRKFTEASEASDELENLRRKYNVALSDLEAANIAVTEVQEQLVILTNRNNESEAKVDELTNKISSMNEEEEKLIKAHAEIAAMTKTIAADKEVIDKIKNDNEQLLNRIETMSTDIATIKERNDELTIIATKYRENCSNDEKKQDQINDLIKENTKLIDNIREMENEMKSLSERILSADINDESLTKTNKELQEIRNKYNNLEEEHKDLLGRHMRTIQLAKDKDDKLEAVKSEEIAQRQHLRNQLSELRKKLDKSEETLDKTVEKAKIAEERVVEVHEEVSVLRNKYDSILKQLDEKNNEIQGYLTNNTDCEKKYLQQIAELNQSREEMMAAAKSSEIAFNKISEELDSVSKKNSNLYKERKDLEANLQDLNRKIKISVDEKSTLKQQNGELIECKKTLEEQIQKLENRLASDERHADEIKLQQVQKESRVQEVQQELYDAKQKIKSLESQVKSMQSDITASSCALKMERESKSEIESKVRVFEGKQQQSFNNENELKKKLRDVEKIKVNVDSKCESLQRQISEISLQNDNLQKTNEALKAEIVRLSEDVEIANQALDEAQENEQKMIEWRKEKDDIVGQFRCALNKIKGEKEELEKEKSEMLTTLGQLKNNMANSEDQINDLLESKEKMQEEKNKLCEKVEKLSADLKHMHQRSEHSKKSSIRNSVKHEDEQQDETLIRASTPQVLLAENRDKVHTPKASEVVPKTANISKIAETTRASVEESITIAETSKLSNVQTTREKKSVAATSKRTRRKRISSNVEESEENSSPPKSLKLDNPSTPVAGRSMRTAKVKAIANLAQIEDPSPSRIPLSLKGEENCSTSKKSSTGKRGIHKVMNNFLQNSPLRRSSKKKTKEEHAIVENSTDRHIPPAKPKRKLYKVQDLNEFTAAMDELSHKETDKTAEVITRQLRPRRR